MRQRAVIEWVFVGVAGFLQVRRGERVLIDDDDPAFLHRLDIRPQGGRVHRDQRVDRVARRVDIFAREVYLEAGDASERALGRANFGREVGERRDVVAHEGRRIGELRTGQLHAVARVATEPNCGFVERKNLFVLLIEYCCRHRWLTYPCPQLPH